VALPTVIVFPALLLTVLFVVQAALWQHYRQIAAAAAQEGASAAAAVGQTSGPITPQQAAESATGDAAAAANAELAQLGGRGANVTTSAQGDTVVVRVTVDVPTVFGIPLHVTASAGRPVELFRPAPPGVGG
jgi:hypothetical protein